MARQQEVKAADYVRQSPPSVSTVDELEVIPPLHTEEARLAIEHEAFMNEMVTIMIAEATDENATPCVEVSVNGRRLIIPRGVEFPVKRMYVERLARAKKTSISQNLDPRLGEGVNKLIRHRALDYPFAVIEDNNPLGREWLKRILAEA